MKLLWIGEALVVLVCVAMLGGVRVNVSASVPVGLYWQLWHSPALTRGQLVTVHIDGRELPVLKPVAALALDVVCRQGGRLLIGDEDYGPFYPEAPAALAEGECLMVPWGFVFLASPHERSYDSRYFGMVAVAQLSGLVQPLWVWEGNR